MNDNTTDNPDDDSKKESLDQHHPESPNKKDSNLSSDHENVTEITYTFNGQTISNEDKSELKSESANIPDEQNTQSTIATEPGSEPEPQTNIDEQNPNPQEIASTHEPSISFSFNSQQPNSAQDAKEQEPVENDSSIYTTVIYGSDINDNKPVQKDKVIATTGNVIDIRTKPDKMTYVSIPYSGEMSLATKIELAKNMVASALAEGAYTTTSKGNVSFNISSADWQLKAALQCIIENLGHEVA